MLRRSALRRAFKARPYALACGASAWTVRSSEQYAFSSWKAWIGLAQSCLVGATMASMNHDSSQYRASTLVSACSIASMCEPLYARWAKMVASSGSVIGFSSRSFCITSGRLAPRRTKKASRILRSPRCSCKKACTRLGMSCVLAVSW